MKKVTLASILIGVTILVVILLGFKSKSELSKGYLTMRTSETGRGGNNSITIVDVDNHVEKIELKPFEKGEMNQNIIIVNENLNKIRSKGYKLIFVTSAVAQQDGVLFSTYTFEKE